MKKLPIICTKGAVDEEKEIFRKTFGEKTIFFSEYKIKSFSGASFDVQFIVDLLNSPDITALVHGIEIITMLVILTRRLFSRNCKKIEDNRKRPRYTVLSFRMKKSNIVVSNVSMENKLIITRSSADNKNYQIEFTEDNLKNILKKELRK